MRAGSHDQRRLLALMADGHARRRHGRELGAPSREAYQARVARHLERAPIAFAVTGSAGGSGHRYLVADPRTNQVAWIPPHKEHRATFFEPRAGVARYIANLRRVQPGTAWRSVDIGAARALDAAPVARRVSSAARDAARGHGAAR